MQSESALAFIDRFIKKSNPPVTDESLIKSRIFVMAALLLVAISLNNLGRLAYAGNLHESVNELIILMMGCASLFFHYHLGRPQYLVVPFALGLVTLLFVLYILPSRSLLAPGMQWIPLITGCVFFISGRPIGWLFTLLMLLITIGFFGFQDFHAGRVPSPDVLKDFQNSMPVVLSQALASSVVLVLVYLNQHKRARIKILALQNQMAQSIKSSESNDFSFNLGYRIHANLKPLYQQFFDPKATPTMDRRDMLQSIRGELLNIKDYMQLLRSVQETAFAEQSEHITWQECLRRTRSLIPGRHGMMMVELDEIAEENLPFPFEARLVTIILECVRYLCYRSMAGGQSRLRIRAQSGEQGLTIILSLHAEKLHDLTPEQIRLTQQKQELCIRFLRDELQRLKGTVQSQQQDRIQWLQVTLPLPAEVLSA
jgi:hypothetical protein